jgi:hypothetical protein
MITLFHSKDLESSIVASHAESIGIDVRLVDKTSEVSFDNMVELIDERNMDYEVMDTTGPVLIVDDDVFCGLEECVNGLDEI